MTEEEQAAAAKAAEEKAKLEADEKAKAEAEAKAKAEAEKNKSTQQDDEKFDRSYVEKIRKDKAAAEAQLKELREKEEAREREEAKKRGEYEKIANDERKKREEAEKKYNDELSKRDQRMIDVELRSAAIEAGIIDADLIRLVDRELVRIGEDGGVEGAKSAIEALKNAKPALFKKDSTDDGQTRQTRQRTIAPNATDRKDKPVDARTLSDEEFTKLWDGVGRRSA